MRGPKRACKKNLRHIACSETGMIGFWKICDPLYKITGDSQVIEVPLVNERIYVKNGV